MKYGLLVAGMLPLLGCNGGAAQSVNGLNRQQIPPSIQAGIHPNFYSRSVYSPKLKRRVREIIPAKDLTPVTQQEEVRIRKQGNEVEAVDEASDALYKIQKRMIKIPSSTGE